MLPFVLDDDGSLVSEDQSVTNYKPLFIQILDRFSAESGSLRNWIIRLVRQHPALQQFLLEQGLHMITDWAILNDTSPDSLQRILRDFYQLTSDEIDFAVVVLNGYREVYLNDRQKQGGRKRCQDPTTEQLQRIAILIEQNTTQILTPSSVLAQLKQLAAQLRQYRIYRRGGNLPQGQTQSRDVPETAERVEYEMSRYQPDEDDEVSTQIQDFLQKFRQEFTEALEQAVGQVVQDRVQKKPKKAEQFLLALELLHCQQKSMSEIAKILGLPRQDSVSYLLQLKQFRKDVRNLVLLQLKIFIQEKGELFISPDRLEQAAQAIEAELESQIDAVIEAAKKETATAKQYAKQGLLAQKICIYLHQAMNVP
ncbi:hypothetical protein IQ266_24690 [filamentous cyanobacterium LEGE 11480]|uniref:Uncharacterized protein n=1 Tax=Romeriopsis navalis LEGE 11480 TaxID=2777977 RepID=A0A928VQJ7_9CYAN|nr:hypothetical protein [Romeriopsis navalis]MBE9032938.1 hypothetical protein [Romeriopsis navalis LEGE 11480]